MRLVPPALAVAVAVGLLLIAAAPSSAYLRSEHGLRVVRDHREWKIVLSRADARQARAWRLATGCATLSRGVGGDIPDAWPSETTFDGRVPARGRKVPTHDARDDVDVCWFAAAPKGTGTEIEMVPVTERGAIYIDEDATARGLRLPGFTDPGAADGPPASIAAVVELWEGTVVAMAGPDASPPQGKVGYWTDGTRAVAAAVTKRGRRLYLDRTGSDVRTNAFALLQDPDL
jgi:hypothetical protein